MKHLLPAALGIGAALLALSGCTRTIPPGTLVVVQTPLEPNPNSGTTVLDARYPLKSRVEVLEPPYRRATAREVSRGLLAAGDPCVSWDGRWIFFAGKVSENSDWQIYRALAAGGKPERVTDMPGGAMNPCLAAHDELIFISPVPGIDAPRAVGKPASLYAQGPNRPPRRLTFGTDDIVDATVLRDGRILFVTTCPSDNSRGRPRLALFTINNDGTEVSAYAGQDGGAPIVRRPRELPDGRVAFLATDIADADAASWAECVRAAAPFATRGKLLGFATRACRSVESMPENDLLICAETRGMFARMMLDYSAVYRVHPGATSLGQPIFDDSQHHTIEAAPVIARPEPAGHTTAVMPESKRGTILSLNVNDSIVTAAGTNPEPAKELRVFTVAPSGQTLVLGKVPVARDGSVLAYLPAEVPLGFDTLDSRGRVLRHQPACIWLQPGENRACVGCHEARNHAPRNARPEAVATTPAELRLPDTASAPLAATP